MTDDCGPGRSRRRPMERIGELIPEAARRLGLADELRLARAGATWDALVAERVPPAVGACRLVRAEGGLMESFYPGPMALAALTLADRLAVAGVILHPGARSGTLCAVYGPRCQPVLTRREAMAGLQGASVVAA